MVQKYKESIPRTIIKTLLLRIIVFTIITTVVIFLLDGSLTDGFEIGTLDIIVELFVHYIYDRVWQKIGWGVIIKDSNDPAKTYPVINLEETEEEETN